MRRQSPDVVRRDADAALDRLALAGISAQRKNQTHFTASGRAPMKVFGRISIDAAVMNGQPCIKGTRLTVRRVLLALAQHPNPEELRKDYPQLQDADIREALEYAAANLDDEAVEGDP